MCYYNRTIIKGGDTIKNTALYLPKKSVRAIFMLSALSAAIYLHSQTGSSPEWLVAVVAMAASWYFKSSKE